MAVSLCADCFAVTLCSSTTLKRIRWSNVALIAIVFAVIQTGLLVLGWLFGSLLASFVIKASHVIGFLLLLYVGGSMLFEGIRGKDEARDLNGLWHIILGGVATSIDALAVGRTPRRLRLCRHRTIRHPRHLRRQGPRHKNRPLGGNPRRSRTHRNRRFVTVLAGRQQKDSPLSANHGRPWPPRRANVPWGTIGG